MEWWSTKWKGNGTSPSIHHRSAPLAPSKQAKPLKQAKAGQQKCKADTWAAFGERVECLFGYVWKTQISRVP
ncbi:hypothetical protein HYFRA_00012176 [Hymenoscyphus fraxineus]|uniref:Uncharacterized protein n=1 Tax=Hymenoscyphus fraxineus TaxID=746836 RepID=A0A9N9PTD3_9HELO|nr:hypothetical protein HYFRA_00012176 [Hymenoscyphus fraxineus]